MRFDFLYPQRLKEEFDVVLTVHRRYYVEINLLHLVGILFPRNTKGRIADFKNATKKS
jgi:coproporphyrinogen III oxidase